MQLSWFSMMDRVVEVSPLLFTNSCIIWLRHLSHRMMDSQVLITRYACASQSFACGFCLCELGLFDSLLYSNERMFRAKWLTMFIVKLYSVLCNHNNVGKSSSQNVFSLLITFQFKTIDSMAPGAQMCAMFAKMDILLKCDGVVIDGISCYNYVDDFINFDTRILHHHKYMLSVYQLEMVITPNVVFPTIHFTHQRKFLTENRSARLLVKLESLLKIMEILKHDVQVYSGLFPTA